MEIKYYINGGSARTWKQVLHWAWVIVEDVKWEYKQSLRCYAYMPSSIYSRRVSIKNLTSSYRHNENDGIRTKGRWKQNHHWEFIQQRDADGRLNSEWIKTLVLDDHKWIPETFTRHRNQVTDNLGRVIPVNLILADLRSYIPNNEDRITDYRYRTRRWNNHSWKFRCGPVPNTSKRKNGWWHRYGGDHCGSRPWKRDWYVAALEQQEIREEYGCTYRMPDKIPYRHNHTNERGWKRTRKKKQWM